MNSARARAAACLLSVCTLLGLGVVAAPTASAATCNGTVRANGPIEVGVQAATTEVWVCFEVAGVARLVGVRKVYEVVEVMDEFACPSPVGGTVGDPAEPPHVDYRVGTYSMEPDHLYVCVGVGTAATSVVLYTEPDPEIVVETPPSGGDYTCGGSGPREDVVVSDNGTWQSAAAGYAPDGGLCLFTYGSIGRCAVFTPYEPVTDALADCPLLDDALQAVDGAIEDLLGLPGEVVGTVTGVVDPVVEDALADVHAIADPVVDDVLDEVGAALGIVDGVVDQLPVEVASTMGSCSVSVASLTSPAVEVRRSPTGQVPASVCVVTGGSGVRLTVG